MEDADLARRLTSPFPLKGGRVGVGGGGTVGAGLAPETPAVSHMISVKPRSSTPTQPSPLEGEG
jgi:hypothetical protein